MSGLTFSVQALNVAIDASLATLSGIADVPFTCDVVADVSMNVADAKALFRFQSDAVDINDVTSADLRYKLNYTSDTNVDADGIPTTVMAANYLTNTLCVDTDNSDHVYSVGTANATNHAVGDDFLRFLAYKLFNTHLGVDLFDNEAEVKANLDKSGRIALDAKLVEIAALTQSGDSWLDASNCTLGDGHLHPTYAIVQAMIATQPSRFNDMSNNYIQGDQSGVNSTSEFSAPFIAGDIIQFQLSISADSQQTGVIDNAGSVSFSPRTYRIRLRLE